MGNRRSSKGSNIFLNTYGLEWAWNLTLTFFDAHSEQGLLSFWMCLRGTSLMSVWQETVQARLLVFFD